MFESPPAAPAETAEKMKVPDFALHASASSSFFTLFPQNGRQFADIGIICNYSGRQKPFNIMNSKEFMFRIAKKYIKLAIFDHFSGTETLDAVQAEKQNHIMLCLSSYHNFAYPKPGKPEPKKLKSA